MFDTKSLSKCWSATQSNMTSFNYITYSSILLGKTGIIYISTICLYLYLYFYCLFLLFFKHTLKLEDLLEYPLNLVILEIYIYQFLFVIPQCSVLWQTSSIGSNFRNDSFIQDLPCIYFERTCKSFIT